MKKALCSITAFLVLAITLVSCNANGPKMAAEKFLTGIYHMDYAAAKTVATEETKKQVDAYEQMMNMMQQNGKEEAKKISVTVKEPKVTGDAATVEYTTSTDSSAKTLKMVKQNGKWLAQWTKMDSMPGGMGGAAGAGGDMHGGSATPANDTMMAPPADGTQSATAADTAKH